MQIKQPRVWSDFVAETSDVDWRLVAHPKGETVGLPSVDSLSSGEDCRIVAAIGPEGGFSDEEIAVAVEVGWRRIGLGPRILRIETAAVLLAGIISASFLE
jgi:16S rRNA (uracil1498-N3)-methyltransferase